MKAPDIVATAPHSPEAEQGVLASMILGGDDVIDEVAEVIDAGAFYVPSHNRIFLEILDSRDKGVAIDLITFTQRLRDKGFLEEIGGAGFVTNLFLFVPSATNVLYYLDIVREKWIRRQMIARATTGVRQAYDDSLDTEKILEELQADVVEIGQATRVHESLKPISEAVPEVLDWIEKVYRRRGQPVGLSTGFVDLDRMTGGFQRGRTYYIAARPAMGKSSLGTEFAEHVAIDNAESQHPVAVFSVEMTAHELTEVILCRRAEVELLKLRDGFFGHDDRSRLDQEAAAVSASSIYIDDKSTLSIFEFRARTRRAVRKFGVKLIIIDYIQRMHSSSKRAQMSRELEINEIAQGISQTAKELQVPIVVLAQLNRDTEKRRHGRPELADIRESGSMEAEAHLVGLLYRPSYYSKNEGHLEDMAEEYGMPVEEFIGYTELIIAKQRRGPVGPVKLRFEKRFARFESEDKARPLFSGREEERQEKSAAPAENVAADLIRSVKDIFPNAEVKE